MENEVNLECINLKILAVSCQGILKSIDLK